MDQQTELTTLRRIVAAWIFDSYAEPSGLTGDQAIAVSAVGHAATALHERVTAAGIDLAPELDALSDQAAAAAFGRFESQSTGTRCPAAHPEDPTPCVGPVVVTVLDAQNAGADGCEHHGARLLASLEGGRVYALPDAPEGAAIRVFKAAGSTRPFPWLTNAPRTEPSQLSRDEVRRRAD